MLVLQRNNRSVSLVLPEKHDTEYEKAENKTGSARPADTPCSIIMLEAITIPGFAPGSDS